MADLSTSGTAWRLSLVIPAFNEQAVIGQAVAEADEALQKLATDYEILVIDDGSTDGTADAVREASASRPQVRLLQHPSNRGYGAALRTGFEAAQFDRVAFTDADCQFHLLDLASLLPLSAAHPIAVGYRLARQDSRWRCFVSRTYNWVARTLLGTRVRDCDCALKVFRSDVLAQLLPDTPGFFVNTEMLARARQRGWAVAEAGVRHRPRARGSSKVSFEDVPRVLGTLLPFWWSRVLFPGSEDSSLTPSRVTGHFSHTSLTRQRRREDSFAGASGLCENRTLSGSDTSLKRQRREEASFAGASGLCGNKGVLGFLHALRGLRVCPPQTAAFVLVALMAALLFFARLSCPLQEPQEPRYAEIPRQMLAESNWLVPVLHGQPYLDKPPLLYWLVMLSYRLCGVHDWAARLVPGGAGFLTVLLTFWWGCRALGLRAGFWGALVLCLSVRFVYLGRLLTMDGLLTLWVVAALATANAAGSGSRLRHGWWLLSALACGLGLLTKGPVALALVVPPLVAWQFLDLRVARPGWRGWLLYGAVALAVAAPWYGALALAQPGFLADFFWRHHVVRFLAPFDHEEPAWFYLPGLLLGTLPWSLLLPGLVRFLGRHSPRTAACRPAALGFLLLAFLWGLMFFSVAGCKRATYILPVMPPLALVLGCYLEVLLARFLAATPGSGLARRGAILGWRTLQVVLALAVGGSVLAVAANLVPPTEGLLAAALTGIGLVCVARRRWQGPPLLPWALCGGVTFAVLLSAVCLLLPSYARKFSLRGLVRPFAGLVEEESLPVACYPRRWDSVSFYLGREDVQVYTADERPQLTAALRRQETTLVFVKAGRHQEEFLAALPAGMGFLPQGRQGVLTVGKVSVRKGLAGKELFPWGDKNNAGSFKDNHRVHFHFRNPDLDAALYFYKR